MTRSDHAGEHYGGYVVEQPHNYDGNPQRADQQGRGKVAIVL